MCFHQQSDMETRHKQTEKEKKHQKNFFLNLFFFLQTFFRSSPSYMSTIHHWSKMFNQQKTLWNYKERKNHVWSALLFPSFFLLFFLLVCFFFIRMWVSKIIPTWLLFLSRRSDICLCAQIRRPISYVSLYVCVCLFMYIFAWVHFHVLT